METLWKTALWRQFGVAIDMQEHAAQLSLLLGQHRIPDEALN